MNLTYKYHLIDDTSYAYTSNGSGEALVLLHGFTGSSKTWQSFIEKWQNQFRVITIDLPGHGKTTGKANLQMKEICHHLTLLFKHVGIEKCHLLGYSMGGRTALSFAIWYPLYIKTLLLESASPGLHAQSEREERVAKDTQLARRIEKEGIMNFVDFWEKIPLFHTQNKLPEVVKQQIRAERLAQTEAGLSASLHAIGTGKQPSWWHHLSDVKVPICLVVGEEDKKFVQLNEKMSKQFPHCAYEVIPNAGHTVHIEQPELFAQTVEQFIQQN